MLLPSPSGSWWAWAAWLCTQVPLLQWPWGLIWCYTHLVAFLWWRVAPATRALKLVVSGIEGRWPAATQQRSQQSRAVTPSERDFQKWSWVMMTLYFSVWFSFGDHWIKSMPFCNPFLEDSESKHTAPQAQKHILSTLSICDLVSQGLLIPLKKELFRVQEQRIHIILLLGPPQVSKCFKRMPLNP